jgi:outer membrane autotransporter protein
VALDTLRVLDYAGSFTTQQVDLRYAVAGLRDNEITPRLTALSGEVHGAIAAAAPVAARWLQNTVAAHLSAGSGEASAGNQRLWVEINAGKSRANGGQVSSDFTSTHTHFAVGADLLQGHENRLGLGVAYSNIRVSPDLGSGTIEDTAPFLYGQSVLPLPRKVIVDGLLSYEFTNWSTNRSDPLRRTGALKTSANGEGLSVGLGIRSPFAMRSVTVEPFARFLWQDFTRQEINEGLGSPAALTLPGKSLNGGRILVGATLSPAQAETSRLSYRATLAIGEDLGQLTRPTVQAQLAGVPFTIDAPHIGRTLVQVDLSASYRIRKNIDVSLRLIGEARKDYLDGGINAGFNYHF